MRVNGEPVVLHTAPNRTLLEVLREDLQLTGTKHGCELGECGACAVLVDGQPVLSCLTLAVECAGSDIVTVEGLATDARLDPLQEAFADAGAVQCGYCTPGFLITARALLDENPNPTRAEISEALSGGLCRCTGYLAILDAVAAAALRLRPPQLEDAGRQHDSTFDLRPSTLGQSGSPLEYTGGESEGRRSKVEGRTTAGEDERALSTTGVSAQGRRSKVEGRITVEDQGHSDQESVVGGNPQGRRSKVEGRMAAEEQKRARRRPQ